MDISLVLKLHFDHLKQILCFSAIFKKCIVFFSSSFFVLVGITKSSSISSCSNSQKILFIIFWNILRELYSLKYITLGSNSLLFIKNDAFHSSPFLIHTLLWSQIRSNLLKYFASLSLSITSSIKGSGILSFIAYWFSFL